MNENTKHISQDEGKKKFLQKIVDFPKKNLYDSPLPKYAAFLKTAVQFTIGFLLICVLVVKGVVEVLQTFDIVQEDRKTNAAQLSPLISHIVSIHTFGYIAAALAISAGIDLGYMLFTDGPDEALTPLLLCISSAAVYTMSNKPEHNWVVGIYVLSILVLICCMQLYKRWNLDKSA